MNRNCFPGLVADQYRDWVRLDGPGGSQMVEGAIQAMADFMRGGHNANLGGEFEAARRTDDVVIAARRSVAELFGADPRGVAFGPSMTALTFRFAAAVGRTLAPGDEILYTRLDHDANVRPWKIAAARAGAHVRFATPDKNLELQVAAIEPLLSPRTRWLAITAASNACGTVPDLAGIIGAARSRGVRVYLDAVHAAPHRRLDLGALGCDAIATSAYKWFGPHIGILCASPDLLHELKPDKLKPSSDGVPEKWELGTLAFESLAGVTEAARYMLQLDWSAVRAHESRLIDRALHGLGEVKTVELYGRANERTPTVMFNIQGWTSREVARTLAERYRIALWHGNYYAWELEQLLGLAPDGAVRAGFMHYNSEEDADRLVLAVRDVAERKAGSA